MVLISILIFGKHFNDKLIYYLSQASLSGRDIIFDQNYRYNLKIRRTLEAIVASYNGNRDSEKFNNFDESFNLLKKESLKYSMNLIKSDLKKLGIEHDNFFSETELIQNKLVDL